MLYFNLSADRMWYSYIYTIFVGCNKKCDKEVLVVSQEEAEGHNIFLTYTPLDNDISVKLFHMASKLTPDVINIQHEYGLFGSESGIQIVDFILSAADVMPMPYEVGAQSGILAQASAFHIPVVTSDLLSFKIWNEEIKGGLTAYNNDDYVENILKILSDDKFAKILENNIIKNTKNRKWYEIAKQHLLIYEKVIKVPYGRGRYFYIPEDQQRTWYYKKLFSSA